VKPIVWVAFLPWLSGLAIWESGWRTLRARGIAVVLVAVTFIAFWSLVTFLPGGGHSRAQPQRTQSAVRSLRA
jgi:hypothetical protein